MKKISTLLILAGLISFVFNPLKAGVIHVETWGTDTVADGSEGNPYGTIQYALNVVPVNDTILVGYGYYYGPITVEKDVYIISTQGPENCYIDGNYYTNAVVFDTCNATLSGFYIYNANELIAVNSSTVQIDNCLLTGSGNGSGIIFNSGSGNIHHNVFVDFSSWGIECFLGYPSIYNNTFFHSGTAIMIETTAFPNVINNIVASNVTGINLNATYYTGILSFNDIWNNATNISDGSYTLDTTNISTDPMFIETLSNDFGLLSGSPCIDAGDPTLFDKDLSRSDIGAIPFASEDIVTFDFYLNSTCQPAYVEFYNNSVISSQGGNEYYIWEFNGTAVYSGFSFDTTLNQGYYYVRLAAYDTNDQLINEFYRDINIYDCGNTDTVDFYLNFSSNCSPANIGFVNISNFSSYSGPVYYEWQINETTFSNEQYPPDTVLYDGYYTFQLIAYDSNYSVLGNTYRYLDIYSCNSGDVYFYVNQYGYCAGDLVDFVNESYFSTYYGEVTYIWNMNGFMYNGFELPDTTLPGGYYYVYLEAYDSLGISLGSYNNDFNVSGSTGIIQSSAGQTACPGEINNFWYDGSSYWNIQWNMGDGKIIYNDNYIQYTYTVEGSYLIKLIVEDDCGIDTITRNITITTTSTPKVNAYTENGESFCPYDEIVFDVEGSFSDVFWTFDDGTVLNQQKVKYAFQDTGKHSAIVKAVNLCGQTGFDTVYINIRTDVPVNPGFYWWFEGYGCPLSTVNFNPYGVGNYLWNFGDGTTSSAQYPKHVYANEGDYMVTLITYNNCGNSETSVNYVPVYYSYGSFYTSFNIITNDDEYYEIYDTIKLCPGEKVSMEPWDNSYETINYFWDFGDGNTSSVKNPSYAWTTPGLKEITMRAKNNCRDTAIAVRYVFIDATIMPTSKLYNIPGIVCPGDEVLFFDMASEDNNLKYVYNIYYGDGESKLNITQAEDPKINSLASHIYPGLGTYTYLFTATNLCNNTDSVSRTILVSSDQSNVPFYYVHNSTQPYDDEQDGKIEDWSTEPEGPFHKFIIPVQWNGWSNDLINTFFVYFWYGEFDPQGDPGEPDGFVSFQSDSIVSGDSVVAYIPIQITEYHSIGLAAGWYCDPDYAGNEPEVMGMPINASLQPILAFPLRNGFTTDLRSYGNIIIDPNGEWDELCSSNQPTGSWKSPDGSGKAYYLSLWKNDSELHEFYLEIGPEKEDQNNSNSFITSGYYEINNDTIIFMPYGTGYECEGNGKYLFTYQGDSIIFNLISDSCLKRSDAINNRKYFKNYYNNYYNYEGCPGDSIEFTVVGGDTYKWDFGDGSTPLTTSERYVKHAYDTVGSYEAFVVITNSCGRIDTIYSEVTIGNQNLPQVYFSVDPWSPEIGDTVSFTFQGYDPSGSFDYTWYFGDGTTPAKGQSAKHVYLFGGEFNPKLIVTNGCGTNTEQYTLYIKGADYCDLEARYSFTIKSDTVIFKNNSYGNVTNISWDFGDGYSSNKLNPVHIYSQSGIYTVCMSVIDTVTNCQDGICLSIQVGNVDCYADFIYSTVDATNTLILTNKSTGSAYWSWNLGDGSTSTLKSPVHTYTSPGVYTVCLDIANADKTCFANTCMNIEVGIIDSTECYPEFAYFTDSLTVAFTDKSTGNITKWYWNFGDGTYSVKRSVIHTYSASGSYEVCLSVYDSVSGCQKQLCKTIQIGTVSCLSKFTYFIDSTLTTSFTDKSIGAVSEWLWDFGDGNMSLKQNPKYTYSNTGIYDVCLTTYDNATNCLSKSCQRITVGKVQDCYADFGFFIDSMTVRFTDLSLGTVNKRYWDFGNGTFGFRANPVVTYKKAGVKNVCYYVFDTITGCQSYVCKEIEVGGVRCNADFTYYIDQESKHVDFYNKSYGPINKWLWDFGNGAISFDTNASITYTNYGIYNVCLTISENVTGGCVSQICKDITVKDTSTNICNTRFTFVITEGTRNVAFKDATQTNVTNWFWEFGDGEFSKSSNVTHTYAKDGTYEVCLSTYDATTGCFSDKCKSITVRATNDSNEILDANFTYLLTEGSSSVEFIDESTGSPTNWYWTFGDGSYTKGDADVTHNYGKTGDYLVCLYIVDEATGNTDDVCKVVPVGESSCSLTANFGKFIDPDTKTVNFTDKSLGSPSKWFWSFGDGNTSSKQNPQYQYTKSGLYLVSLSIRDASGQCSDYIADFIQVGSIDCKADFTYTVDADSNKIVLSDASQGDVTKYFWSFDDGTFGKNANTTHKYKKPGMYMVGLTISTSGGTCTDYTSEPVQIGTVECNAGFSAYVDSAENMAYFKNEVIGNSTLLLWQFGDGAISSKENPIHKYKKPGYYTVGLNTYDINTNCMDYTEQLILIGSKGIDCEADFYYQVDGKDVDFYNKSVGETLDYFWYFGDGSTTSTLMNPSVSYVEGGYYHVCLTVYTQGGIQNTRCKFVAVDPPSVDNCLAQFIYTVDSTNRTVTFTDQSLGEPNKWLWKFGDDATSSEQNPSHTYAQNGFYKVRLVSGSTVSGCKSRAWEMINVGVGTTGLKAGFGYEIDSLDLKTGGYPVDFVGVSAGKPARYVWDFGDGSSDSTTTSPTHSYSQPGQYNVCLTVEDQVTEESDQSCDLILIEDTSSVEPEFIPAITEETIELNSYPNPFTGYTNITYSIPFVTRVELVIFDESGRLIKPLISTMKEAGTYKLTWDATDIANGLYYIQLKTGNGYTKTKMIVKR